MINIDNKEVEFIEGMTVADALKAAGESIVDQMIIVMVDGNVISKSDLFTTYIADKTKISLLRLISGG